MQTRYLLLLLFPLCATLQAQSNHELWFDEPATAFEETLVLGNGRVGASVFGGIETDSIFLNDATLWSAEPVDPNMNPNAHASIPAIRAALKAENYRLADSLQRNLQGSFSQSYAPLGTLHLTFQHPMHLRPRQKKVSNYRRSLDIDRAIVTQTYSLSGVDFSREYFVSHPDKVMVIRLKASKPGALSFDLGFTSQLRHTIDPLGTDLAVNGYAPYHAEPSYRRLSLNLGPTNAKDVPTDERLKRHGTGAEDRNLEILYLQYGRYLLIAGSRTPEVPANLQGGGTYPNLFDAHPLDGNGLDEFVQALPT